MTWIKIETSFTEFRKFRYTEKIICDIIKKRGICLDEDSYGEW